MQLCRELFGMQGVSVDLSPEACRRAAELFAVPGCAVDAGCLPFADASFDVVLCAEVIEHLEAPVPAILELQRVAAQTLVFSSQEWQKSARHRDRELQARETEPHTDRSILADADLRALFAPHEVVHQQQVVPDRGRFGDDRRIDSSALRTLLVNLPSPRRFGTKSEGIFATVHKRAERPVPHAVTDAAIADHLLQRRMPVHRLPEQSPEVPWPAWCAMQCVRCRARALPVDGGFCCDRCGERYRRENGVVSFLRELPDFAGGLEQLLAARGGPAYPMQARDLLALADKLHLPFVPPTSWDFPAQLHRWRGNAHLSGSGGTWTVTGDDPQLESPSLGHASHDAAEVRVDCTVASATGSPVRAQVFWWLEGERHFSEGNSVVQSLPGDGVPRTHVFLAPPAVLLGDRLVMKVRLDPMSGERGTVSVRRIALGSGS